MTQLRHARAVALCAAVLVLACANPCRTVDFAPVSTTGAPQPPPTVLAFSDTDDSCTLCECAFGPDAGADETQPSPCGTALCDSEGLSWRCEAAGWTRIETDAGCWE